MTSDVVFQADERHRVRETLSLLHEQCPCAFVALGKTHFQPHPLKINIHLDLAELISHAREFDLQSPLKHISEEDLQSAFDFYCGTRAYLEHQIEGRHRVDLDGREAGFVTTKEAALARLLLEERDWIAVRREIGRGGLVRGKRVIFWREGERELLWS